MSGQKSDFRIIPRVGGTIASAGVVLSVTATSPIISSGGPNPNISRDPNFTATTLALGPTPAAAGSIRLTNATTVSWDSALAAGDVVGLQVTAADRIVIGDDINTVAIELRVKTAGVVQTYVNNVQVAEIGASYVSVGAAPAAAGAVRLTNNTTVSWDSALAAAGQDVVGLSVLATDRVVVGDIVNAVGIDHRVKAAGSHTWVVGATALGTFTLQSNFWAMTADAAVTNGFLLAANNASQRITLQLVGASSFVHCSVTHATGFIVLEAVVTRFREGGSSVNSIVITPAVAGTSIVIDSTVASFDYMQSIRAGTGANNGARSRFVSQFGQAQAGGAANNNGGAFEISTGSRGTGGAGAAGLSGPFRLQIGGENMFEALEIAAGRRIVSLCRVTAITTTEMPANTGDLVAYLGNAATAPTADPVAGVILYATGGTFGWRGPAASMATVEWGLAAAAANAGAGALPAAPQEFATILYNGNVRKIPLYLN